MRDAPECTHPQRLETEPTRLRRRRRRSVVVRHCAPVRHRRATENDTQATIIAIHTSNLPAVSVP